MSLLSKLLGGKKPSLSDVVELFQEKEQKPASRPVQHSYNARPEPAYTAEAGEETPIGRSWGERMPNEPNQYNFNGSYREYFEDIFGREFAAYRTVRAENPRSDKASSYTFFAEGRPVLVVELLSRNCDAKQIREGCRRSGTPYLRFYYDYHGWWNARSYVVNRINNALGRV